MIGKMILATTLALSTTSISAGAARTYVNIEQRLTQEQLHASGLDTLSPVQLAQLNRLLRDESVTATAIENPQVNNEPNNGSFLGLDQEPIKSKLKGSVSGWEPGSEFHLENGQTWKVLKGSVKLRKPLEAPEILVVPGFAGRWFFQVDEDLPKARVYRID